LKNTEKKVLKIFDLYTKFDNMLVNKFFDFEIDNTREIAKLEADLKEYENYIIV